jgi:hypothetical protein
MSTRTVSLRIAVVGSLLVLAAGGKPLLAQESPGPFPERDGHRFSPTRIVPVPSVSSYVVSTLGGAQAFDITTPPFVVDGDTIPGLQGDLLFATLDLEYQQKIVDWFAFRIGYRVDARLGTELETLISRGVNTITGFEIGWLARLLESDRDLLMLDARVSNKNFTTVDIGGFVQDVIDGIDARIVRKTNAVRVAGGLRYAHAFSELFGIVANGELGVGESVVRNEDDEVFYRLGGQLDFDFDAWRDIPLNAALGFQTDSYPEATEDVDGNLNTGFLRLSYIARDDFTVGLTFFGSQIPTVVEQENLNYGGVEFDLRYFF